MSSDKFQLYDDIEELVQKLVVAEVSQAVWESLEKAMSQLDPESRVLLETHLNTTSSEKLSEKTGLPVKQIDLWLNQVKRELQQNLRKTHRARH